MLYIAFEGPEGGGKNTQVRLLEGALVRKGYTVLVTEEPGGTPVGEAIREILLHRRDFSLGERTQALLFSAARSQFVNKVFPRALKEGIDVILSVRSFYSTLAYQGYGYGLDKLALAGLTVFAVGQVVPDLVILLDLPVEEGLKRKHEQKELNVYEEAALDYHNCVRAGYLEMAEKDPRLWVVVDATKTIEEVYACVFSIVLSRLDRTSRV